MKEIRLEQNEIKDACSRLWNETSKLLTKHGMTEKDYATRALLPLMMAAMVVYKRVPLTPINTLHRRTIDTMDDRSLLSNLSADQESAKVLISSRVNMNYAPWADIRLSNTTRFLRFTKNGAHIFAFPDDPQYHLGVPTALYHDPMDNYRSHVLAKIGVADLRTIAAYRQVLEQIKSQYR